MRLDSTVTVIGTFSDVEFDRDFYAIETVIEASPERYSIIYKQQYQPLKDTTNPELQKRFKDEERRNFIKHPYSNTAIHLASAIT